MPHKQLGNGVIETFYNRRRLRKHKTFGYLTRPRPGSGINTPSRHNRRVSKITGKLQYRTMPMAWYIPPLSPVVDAVRDTGRDAEDHHNLFAAVESLRIPVDYLAQLFTAGDPQPVDAVLHRLAAMRSYMRDINLGREPNDAIPKSVGMSGEQVYDMYRLLALAKYDERYVIPPAHAEQAHKLEELATECSLDYEGGPGMGGSGPFGETSGGAAPIAVENFHALRDRQTSDTPATPTDRAARVNLLNWDGKGSPPGLFPDNPSGSGTDVDQDRGGEGEPKP